MIDRFVVLVCGGRDYDNMTMVCEILDQVHAKYGRKLVIVTGAQRKLVGKRFIGADYLAEEWARSRQVEYMGFPATWDLDGRAAGMQRNARMFHQATPDAVVAFPGGVGTAGMVKIAKDAGLVLVWEVQ